MDYLSKEEAQCVHEAYAEQGIISVIREKSKGFVCEIPKELNTWDKRSVVVGDLLYYYENPNTCLELLSITPVDDCTSFKITVRTADKEQDMVVNDFSEFKTSPWTVQERVKMMTICAVAMSVAILLVAGLVSGFLYLVWSDLVPNLIMNTGNTSSEAEQLNSLMLQAWSMIKCVITIAVVYAVLSNVLKRVMK